MKKLIIDRDWQCCCENETDSEFPSTPVEKFRLWYFFNVSVIKVI